MEDKEAIGCLELQKCVMQKINITPSKATWRILTAHFSKNGTKEHELNFLVTIHNSLIVLEKAEFTKKKDFTSLQTKRQ